MLVHEGETRTSTVDLLLAAMLACVAGGVNSAGYSAYGYFSANMTGNVSMVSDHLSMLHWGVALAFLAIVTMFIAGAFSASLLIQLGKRRNRRNIYAVTLMMEAVVLLATGGWALTASTPALGIVSLLSFAMGIQNAASTRISASRVRTTHVSGIATDIGVGLAILFGRDAESDRHQVMRRLLLHCATIAAFMIGGIAGVVGYGLMGGYVFGAFAVVLAAVSCAYLR